MKIVYQGGEITSDELLSFLVLTRQFDTAAAEIIMHREVLKKARELNVGVSDEELQQFADDFRAQRSLYTADEMNNFLDAAGLSEDDFEAFCESSLLSRLLREKLADERAMETYFVNNRSQFDYARISVILVNEENLAREIIMQVTEEGQDFHALARRHSLDEATKYAGGYRGLVARSIFPEELSAKVFSASPGDLLGPYRHEGMFQLILIEEIQKAALSGHMREVVRECIFREWIATLVRKGITITR